MKIEGMTLRTALDLMGSEAKDEEAEALITILQGTGYSDTRHIPDDIWEDYLAQAIRVGNGAPRFLD